MISTRSTLTRCFIGGQRGNHKAVATFFQTPSSAFSSNKREEKNDVSGPPIVRHFTSPAHRRHLLKQAKTVGLDSTKGAQPSISAHRAGIQVPSLEVARNMGWGFSEMENEPLAVIAEMGNHRARKEVLTRHIMAVDNVDYVEAIKTLEEIACKNREGLAMATMPYKIAIFVALTTGFGSIPMVFDIDLALWFNEKFVTMEIPPPDDLDTCLETGAWTWNWMEPILGTLSYTLLTLQVARQGIKNLGMKPYTSRLIEMRAKKLFEAYPQYEKGILHNFVETDAMVKV